MTRAVDRRARRRSESEVPGRAFYIVLRGPLGVGKSTVASALARRARADVISIDRLVDSLPDLEWKRGYISLGSFLRTSRLAVARARPLLDKGRTVIFDGNFYWRTQIRDLERQLPYPHLVCTLSGSISLCLARDAMRQRPYGAVAVHAVHRRTMSFSYGTRFDARPPVGAIVARILARVRAGRNDVRVDRHSRPHRPTARRPLRGS